MPRDYRHKQAQPVKSAYQRKSQAKTGAMHTGRPLFPMLMAGVFLVALVSATGLFINQQLADGADSSATVNHPVKASVTPPVKTIMPAPTTDVVAKTSVVNETQNVDDKTATEETVTEVEESSESALQLAQDFLKKFTADDENPTEAEQKVTVAAMDVASTTETAKAKPEPVYSFYQGLGEVEVLVDAEPLPVQMEKLHYIQAGSFGSKSVALSEQRRLAKHGVKVDLSEYQGTKRIYYRLISGPYKNRLELNKHRNELRRLGASTLVFKVSEPQ